MWKNRFTCKEKPATGNHRFEPRFEKRYPEGFFRGLTEMQGTPDKFMEKIYIRDICTYCGEVKERNIASDNVEGE